MVVKYDDGFEETISEALKQGHIDIQILDKFDISYIKEEKEQLYGSFGVFLINTHYN